MAVSKIKENNHSHQFMEFRLLEEVLRHESNRSTPPIYILYSFTLSGQVIGTLVPSLLRRKTCVVALGSLIVIIKATGLLSSKPSIECHC